MKKNIIRIFPIVLLASSAICSFGSAHASQGPASADKPNPIQTDITECTRLATELSARAFAAEFPGRHASVVESIDTSGGRIEVLMVDTDDGTQTLYVVDTSFNENGKCRADSEAYHPA